MSLINDALRRARQAQPPPRADTTKEGPAFRAPLPPRASHQPIPFLPAFCMAAIGVTALIIAWNWKVHHPSAPLEAQARSLPASPAPNTGQLQETAQPAQPEAVQPGGTEKLLLVSTEITGGAPVAPPDEAAATNSPAETTATVAATTPAPPPPKLQSIIYNPQRPSAMIDGKVLFIGDKLREFRVIAITPTGATLASASATNHLEL